MISNHKKITLLRWQKLNHCASVTDRRVATSYKVHTQTSTMTHYDTNSTRNCTCTCQSDNSAISTQKCLQTPLSRNMHGIPEQGGAHAHIGYLSTDSIGSTDTY